MRIPEIFRHLEYFSKEDYTHFEKFLMSPYFNTNKSLNIVFRIINKHNKFIEDKEYDKLKTSIILKTGYSEKTVSKILSYLSDMYIDFTKVESYKSDKIHSEINHCNYLLLKGNYELLNKRVKYLESIVSDHNYFEQNIFLHLHEFQILKYGILHSSQANFDPLVKLFKQKENTIESSKNLMVYTLAVETIGFVNYVLQCGEDKTMKVNFPVNLKNMFSFVKTDEFKAYNRFQKITITLFHKLFLLFKNPTSTRYYYDYKNYFYRVKNLFNNEFNKMNLSILLSFCNFRQHFEDGQIFYSSEVINISFEYINNMYYINEKTKYLHSIIYRNFVLLCENNGKSDALKELIEKHTEKLNPRDRNGMKDFAMIHYYFMTNEMELSLNCADSLTNLKYYYRLDIYRIKIKIYYAQNDFYNFENTIRNMKDYVKKIKILSNSDIVKYKYLFGYLELLIRAHRKYDKTRNILDFEFLLTKIESTPIFTMRKWIEEKVSEFIRVHNSKIKH